MNKFITEVLAICQKHGVEMNGAALGEIDKLYDTHLENIATNIKQAVEDEGQDSHEILVLMKRVNNDIYNEEQPIIIDEG